MEDGTLTGRFQNELGCSVKKDGRAEIDGMEKVGVGPSSSSISVIGGWDGAFALPFKSRRKAARCPVGGYVGRVGLNSISILSSFPSPFLFRLTEMKIIAPFTWRAQEQKAHRNSLLVCKGTNSHLFLATKYELWGADQIAPSHLPNSRNNLAITYAVASAFQYLSVSLFLPHPIEFAMRCWVEFAVSASYSTLYWSRRFSHPSTENLRWSTKTVCKTGFRDLCYNIGTHAFSKLKVRIYLSCIQTWGQDRVPGFVSGVFLKLCDQLDGIVVFTKGLAFCK